MSFRDQNFEEDTYSQIFSALKHPIRRGIMRMIDHGPKSYTELLDALGIDSPRLNYHLQRLGDLAKKTEDGKYRLSTIGRAAIKLIEGVEEPVLTFKSKLWKKLQIFGGILSILSFVLILVSQIKIGEAPKFFTDHLPAHWMHEDAYLYRFRWLQTPAIIILAVGVTFLVCGYLVKRNHRFTL